MSAARALRERLVPVRTQREVAEIMSQTEGRKVSKSNVELWEMAALDKVLRLMKKSDLEVLREQEKALEIKICPSIP